MASKNRPTCTACVSEMNEGTRKRNDVRLADGCLTRRLPSGGSVRHWLCKEHHEDLKRRVDQLRSELVASAEAQIEEARTNG